MDWQSPPKGFLGAKTYSAHFHFLLTPKETWFWQVGTTHPPPKVSSKLSRPRLLRQKISQAKFQKLTAYLPLIIKNPFILAVFITGSLAMNNCAQNDDIDLMFITRPHSLWLSRLWNILVLSRYHLRRSSHFSEHSSEKVKDKICDNLYLENLRISPKNLYLAHEILQAKPVYDPYGTHRQFLLHNSWTKTYLPIAYRETLKHSQSSQKISHHHWLLIIGYWLLNLIAFVIQFLYMSPKITREKISLHQAFFHPNSNMI